jgi:hypothetical protein
VSALRAWTAVLLLGAPALADPLAECQATCDEVARICTEACLKKAKSNGALCKQHCKPVGDGCKKECSDEAGQKK